MTRLTIILTAILLAPAALAQLWTEAPAESKVLTVDRAFMVQPAERHGDRIRLAWDIADGHYLYRHRLGVHSDDASLGEPAIPDGTPAHDEHFGDIEIYRDRLVVWVAVTEGSASTVTVTYQGCADVGLCYPPQSRTLPVDTL